MSEKVLPAVVLTEIAEKKFISSLVAPEVLSEPHDRAFPYVRMPSNTNSMNFFDNCQSIVLSLCLFL